MGVWCVKDKTGKTITRTNLDGKSFTYFNKQSQAKELRDLLNHKNLDCKSCGQGCPPEGYIIFGGDNYAFSDRSAAVASGIIEEDSHD